MGMYNRLVIKMRNRIGKKAVSKEDMVIGTINDFTIETIDEGTYDARLTVNYVINYGDYSALVNENNVIIMK